VHARQRADWSSLTATGFCGRADYGSEVGVVTLLSLPLFSSAVAFAMIRERSLLALPWE